MKNKEVIEGLDSAFKSRVEALEAVQAEGIKALSEMDEAKAAGDQGRVAEASEKIDRIGADIEAAQKAIEEVQKQKGWFKDYAVDEDDSVKEITKEERLEAMKSFFDEIKDKVTTPAVKRSLGEEYANMLKRYKISSWADVDERGPAFRHAMKLGALLANDRAAEDDMLKGMASTKSMYTNNGVELLDGNDDPIPGFVGYQCGLVEDRSLACLLDPPADDFEECLTQLTMPAGNRIRFTREVSRDNNAAGVLETVYNPYPTFAQDGTKPESIFTLATSEENVRKLAHFVTASDEVLEDCPSIASLIDSFLVTGLNQEKRRQLIAGNGSATQFRGILNQPDLLTRGHQVVLDGGTADDNIYDTFRRSLTDLWLQSARTDNVCVIMNPRDGEIIDLMKKEDGTYLFNESDCFSRNLRCLSIRYSVDMPQGTAVLGEFANNWVFYVRKAIQVSMGYTGDQFITNTNTILAEMRGLTLVRCPRKIIKVTGLA